MNLRIKLVDELNNVVDVIWVEEEVVEVDV